MNFNILSVANELPHERIPANCAVLGNRLMIPVPTISDILSQIKLSSELRVLPFRDNILGSLRRMLIFIQDGHHIIIEQDARTGQLSVGLE